MESNSGAVERAADWEAGIAGTEPVVNYGTELSAITTIVSALQALRPDGQRRVLQYVIGLFGKESPRGSELGQITASTVSSEEEHRPGQLDDIRSLKEKKEPRSSVEMGALVAYYLAEVAPEDQRSSTVSPQDLQAHFKQAGFPVPAKPRNVLFQAAEAGYMTAVERGQYSLTPVGYNFVVHRMPLEASGPKARMGSSRSRKRRDVRKTIINQRPANGASDVGI
jgi:hypothetical protein